MCIRDSLSGPAAKAARWRDLFGMLAMIDGQPVPGSEKAEIVDGGHPTLLSGFGRSADLDVFHGASAFEDPLSLLFQYLQ